MAQTQALTNVHDTPHEALKQTTNTSRDLSEPINIELLNQLVRTNIENLYGHQ